MATNPTVPADTSLSFSASLSPTCPADPAALALGPVSATSRRNACTLQFWQLISLVGPPPLTPLQPTRLPASTVLLPHPTPLTLQQPAMPLTQQSLPMAPTFGPIQPPGPGGVYLESFPVVYFSLFIENGNFNILVCGSPIFVEKYVGAKLSDNSC
ncbi:hypothetical protein SAY86_020928 [Trapa natans]|uniref:Uncharacterized protein n=1 Tax=Trapa natans TaxID=22666 RepID=A0AAN7M9M0_TRANT|nr:hypothetical protein SAY86_020928 [Trapa natans]